MKRICKCGCGGQVKVEGGIWLAGHHMRRQKMRRIMAAEVRAHKRLSTGTAWNKGLTKETSKAVAKQAATMRGVKQSQEHIDKIVATRRRKGSYRQSAETQARKSRSLKKAWKNPESGFHTAACKNSQQRAANRRKYIPWGQWKYMGKKNRAEAKLERFLSQRFPEEFKYVGDKQVCIGKKFPDFINVNGRKELVELFGDRVHGPEFTGRRRCDESRIRKSHFKKFGFNCAIIWTKQLNNEERLFQSICEQLGR